MCGRYSLTHPARAIAECFDVTVPEEFAPRYNAAPSQHLPVIRRGSQADRELVMLRWGLIPFWAKDEKIGYRMINARSETAAKKPAFRQAIAKRRCLVVFDGFYEWVEKDKKKWPLRITFEDGQLGAFAGMWERWQPEGEEALETYTILTTDADEVLTDVHDRMPLYVPESRWDQWLDTDNDASELMAAIRAEFPAESVGFYPVSRELNRPQNDSAELVEPIEEEGLPRRLR